MSGESDDFTGTDDPEFLAEPSRMRAELQRAPGRAVRAELAALYRRIDDEFIRRARVAWTAQLKAGE